MSEYHHTAHILHT